MLIIFFTEWNWSNLNEKFIGSEKRSKNVFDAFFVYLKPQIKSFSYKGNEYKR